MKRECLMNSNTSNLCYEAPVAYVVEVCVERGFEVSSEGIDGPTYGEEDIW
ncbi:MAG: hypothetical protein J6U93_00930 [Alistipes sp.]|nr:hypothetical protein [Alistipes sp.]MBO7263065.1 hypothetical protein [Alistipes sp.]